MPWHNLKADPEDLPPNGYNVVIKDGYDEYHVAFYLPVNRWGQWFDGIIRELDSKPVAWLHFERLSEPEEDDLELSN
jgi:hypothetical protein